MRIDLLAEDQMGVHCMETDPVGSVVEQPYRGLWAETVLSLEEHTH